jgi:hypothetical protein
MKFLKYGSTGPQVRALQKLVNKNPYRKVRKPLEVDGEWGPLTSGGVQGCKYWCGYAKDDIEPIAGDLIFDLLSGQKPLPPEYAARRAARLQKVKDGEAEKGELDKLRLRALKIIHGELGTLQRPNNSNHIKYNDWWGWGAVAYCVIGVSWAWVKAGSKAFVKGSRWAGCTQMLADAKAGGKGIHLTHDPDPGCPGVVDLYGDAHPDHCVTFVKANADGRTAETYEFNTSKDGTYIQGVWNKTRLLKDCWWFEVEA